MLWNWNLLGDGTHLVEALDDGIVFASAMVTVVTLGEEFARNLSGKGLVTLSNGQQVTVEWSEPRQGLIVTAVSGDGSLITAGLWLGSGRNPPTLICFNVSGDGSGLTAQGSPCDTEIVADASLSIKLTNLTDDCAAELETDAEIPTVNTTFSHTETVGNQTITVTGNF